MIRELRDETLQIRMNGDRAYRQREEELLH